MNADTHRSRQRKRDGLMVNWPIPDTSCCSAATKQVLCGVVVSAAMVQVGAVVAWPVVLPEVMADNTTSLNITTEDIKWLVSCTGITGTATTVLAGSLMELVGPRLLLTLALLPSTFCWLVQALTSSVPLVYVARVCLGFMASLITTLTSPLMAELFEPSLRGQLCSLPEVFVALALVTVYWLAKYLPWRAVTCLCAAPLLPLALLSTLVPETPYWLVRKGRLGEAEAALCSLRGPGRAARAEELQTIRVTMEEYRQRTLMDQVRQLRVAQHQRPVVLLVLVMVLKELGGQYAVFSYTPLLLRRIGLQLDALSCTIAVGVVRLAATVVSSALVDRVGRRVCLIGACGTCAAAAITGGGFILAEEAAGRASWVPLAAVLVFVAGYGVGVGPVPWVLVGELLPTPVRSLGASICSFFFAATQFVVGYLFPALVGSVGVGGALLVFGSANVVLTGVVWAWLPETQHQTLHQLHHAFTGRPNTRPLLDVTHNLLDDSIDVTHEDIHDDAHDDTHDNARRSSYDNTSQATTEDYNHDDLDQPN